MVKATPTTTTIFQTLAPSGVIESPYYGDKAVPEEDVGSGSDNMEVSFTQSDTFDYGTAAWWEDSLHDNGNNMEQQQGYSFVEEETIAMTTAITVQEVGIEAEVKEVPMTDSALATAGVGDFLPVTSSATIAPSHEENSGVENSCTYFQFDIDQCYEPEIRDVRTRYCSDPLVPVLHGADVVEYYHLDQGNIPPTVAPVLGCIEFPYVYQNEVGNWTFLFKSQDNMELFSSTPHKYLPAYGGYCAFGLALEEKSFSPNFISKLGPYGDISKWAWIKDRLMVFGGEGPMHKFLLENPLEHALEANDIRHDPREEYHGIEETNPCVTKWYPFDPLQLVICLADLNWSNFYPESADPAINGHFNTNCFHSQTYEDAVAGVITPSAKNPSKLLQ